LFVIDDGITNASSKRPGEAPQGPDAPALELRSEMRAEPALAPDPIGDPLRDIAREPPRDIARDAVRLPIRDIAHDAGNGAGPATAPPITPAPTPVTAAKETAARDTLRERLREPIRDPLRDQQRDQLQELLREASAAREPPRQPPPVAPQPAPQAAAAAPQAVAVRTPGLSLLTILVLILGIVGAGLLAWQLTLLQGQMNDVRAAIAQNGKIADAASRLSDAATQASEIANQSLAGATRPWVGVDAVEAAEIRAGQPLTIEVRVRNSGRTPSTDVQGLFLVYISPIDNPPALLADQCASCVRSVVLPNGVVSYKLSVRENVMSADEVQRIKDGKDTMWIVGRLDYHDGEGEAHTTRSCLYYRGTGIPAFTACSDGNSAN
jgi:hypothetical protein